MPGRRPASYGHRVRVVIEFDGSTDRWSGILRAEGGPTVDAPFDGRLDLLRLLEAIVGRDDHNPPFRGGADGQQLGRNRT